MPRLPPYGVDQLFVIFMLHASNNSLYVTFFEGDVISYFFLDISYRHNLVNFTTKSAVSLSTFLFLVIFIVFSI